MGKTNTSLARVEKYSAVDEALNLRYLDNNSVRWIGGVPQWQRWNKYMTLLSNGAISFVTNDALEKGVEVERKGLGTPVTRVGVIENLIYKGFIERDKKNLIATHKGISLVTIVADSFKSAETTAKWEMELSDIAQGKSSKEEFLKDIENEIKEVVLTYTK